MNLHSGYFYLRVNIFIKSNIFAFPICILTGELMGLRNQPNLDNSQSLLRWNNNFSGTFYKSTLHMKNIYISNMNPS